MFGFFKKKYSETPWKTADGTYKCQSDICPPDMCGSGRCPLDLQTSSFMLMDAGKYESARDLLARAITIAPDCAQLWCNLGACFGNLGEHVKARDAFRTALRYRPDYPDAKKWLAVAEKNINGGIADVKSVHYMDILEKLLDAAVTQHDMREKAVKHVPELLCYADGIYGRIMSGIVAESKARGQTHDLMTDIQTTIEWSIYAGVGAVQEWNTDWPRLKECGLFERLTEERGYYAMDEYVTEHYTGEHCDTDAGIIPESFKAFSSKVSIYRMLAMAAAMENCSELKDREKAEYFMSSLPEICKGCYCFGMALGLEKIFK